MSFWCRELPTKPFNNYVLPPKVCKLSAVLCPGIYLKCHLLLARCWHLVLIASEGSLNGSLSEPDLAGSFTSLLLTRYELRHIPWGQPVLKHPYHPLRSFILDRLRRCQVCYSITPLRKPFCVVQLTKFPKSRSWFPSARWQPWSKQHLCVAGSPRVQFTHVWCGLKRGKHAWSGPV